MITSYVTAAGEFSILTVNIHNTGVRPDASYTRVALHDMADTLRAMAAAYPVQAESNYVAACLISAATELALHAISIVDEDEADREQNMTAEERASWHPRAVSMGLAG